MFKSAVIEHLTRFDRAEIMFKGNGLDEEEQSDLWGAVTDINGIESAIVTRKRTGLERASSAKWEDLLPELKQTLEELFLDLRVTIRESGREPDWSLGAAELAQIRECFADCALTEDEREALGY